MRTTHKAVGLLQWLRSSQLSQQHGTESEAVRASGAAALSARAAAHSAAEPRTERAFPKSVQGLPESVKAHDSQSGFQLAFS